MRYYLDYNASAPMSEEVKAYIVSVLEKIGNPSSIHNSGRVAKKILEDSRFNIANFINCKPDNIIFTSGATEANNLALNGFQKKIISSIEHESIRNQQNVININVDKDGYLDLEMLVNVLKKVKDKKKSIISVMYANNETGIIQPIEKIKKIANKYNILFHTDAVQAAGRVNIDFSGLGIDMLTLSSHKLGGPLGAGALVISSKKIIRPMFFGGQQEDSIRSGTEPLLCIAGFGEAVKYINKKKINDVNKLRMYFENKLKKTNLGINIIGEKSKRLPNTIMIYVPKVKADTLLIALDLEGFDVSTGSACSSGKVEPSSVLIEMGFDKKVASSSIRLSLGQNNTVEDADKFTTALTKILKRVKNG